MANDIKPPTYDHLKSMKKPTVKTVSISLDDDLQEAYNIAKEALEAAQANSNGSNVTHAGIAKAKKAVEEAKAAAEGASITFKFRSIGRKKYDDLVDQFPATDDQKAEVARFGGDPDNLAWDPDKFPVALMAASILEPALTAEQVQEMYDSDDWSASELSALSVAALEANNSRRIVSLGNG